MSKSTRISAGLLMFRQSGGQLELFLAHPGGPYFRHKDAGWWTIPKGEPEPGEELLQTAIREFQEETGIVPRPPFFSLGEVKQKGGKIVHAWAFEGNWQPADGLQCNTFRMEWPPKSGKFQGFPEVDQAEWMSVEEACKKINQAQTALIEQLIRQLNA